MTETNFNIAEAHEQTPAGLQKLINDTVEGVVSYGTVLRIYYMEGVAGREKDFFMSFYGQFASMHQFTAGMLLESEAGQDVVERANAWLATDISANLNHSKIASKSPLKEHALQGIVLSSEYLAALVERGIISIRK